MKLMKVKNLRSEAKILLDNAQKKLDTAQEDSNREF